MIRLERPIAKGRTEALHRLNRTEYKNAVRDLLGVEADLSGLLPSDGGDFGFDNIAEVLTTSPLLLERYLTVALRVADMAVGNPDAAVTATAYRIPFELTQDFVDRTPAAFPGYSLLSAFGQAAPLNLEYPHRVAEEYGASRGSH